MSELFKREDYLSDKEKASQVFTESFRNMTDEVDRVASEEVFDPGFVRRGCSGFSTRNGCV